jgi:hypothetical protein
MHAALHTTEFNCFTAGELSFQNKATRRLTKCAQHITHSQTCRLIGKAVS